MMIASLISRWLKTAAYFNVGDQIVFGRWKNKRGIIIRLFTDDRGVPMVEVEPTPKGRKKNKIFSLFKVWSISKMEEFQAQKAFIQKDLALKVAARFQLNQGTP